MRLLLKVLGFFCRVKFKFHMVIFRCWNHYCIFCGNNDNYSCKRKKKDARDRHDAGDTSHDTFNTVMTKP
jgi:hypothetical protein